MVHIVGAGSGAIDLITVRGMKILEKCDVCIYAGSLVNKELLSYCKEGVEIYDSATMTLEEIVDTVEKAEKEGKTTCRLQTGDTSIYGSIREQMNEFNKKGIKYDITPGVSAMNGAASSLMCEYTPSGVSQTVIVTRCEGKTPVPERENLKSLATHNATMVLFLSSSLLEKSQSDLIEGGMSKDTKAAIIYKATWADEKIFRCTLGTLAQTAKENNITKTALIVVGNCLGEDCDRSQLYSGKFSTEFREKNE